MCAGHPRGEPPAPPGLPTGCRTCGRCSPPAPRSPPRTHGCVRRSSSPGPASTESTSPAGIGRQACGCLHGLPESKPLKSRRWQWPRPLWPLTSQVWLTSQRLPCHRLSWARVSPPRQPCPGTEEDRLAASCSREEQRGPWLGGPVGGSTVLTNQVVSLIRGQGAHRPSMNKQVEQQTISLSLLPPHPLSQINK